MEIINQTEFVRKKSTINNNRQQQKKGEKNYHRNTQQMAFAASSMTIQPTMFIYQCISWMSRMYVCLKTHVLKHIYFIISFHDISKKLYFCLFSHGKPYHHRKAEFFSMESLQIIVWNVNNRPIWHLTFHMHWNSTTAKTIHR